MLTCVPSHELTDADFVSVRALIEDVRQTEKLGNAIVAWSVAYRMFLRIQHNLWADKTPGGRSLYLSIISDLRGSGYWLMAEAEKHLDQVEMKEVGATALRTSLSILEGSDYEQFLDQNPEAMAKLEALFA